MMKRILVCVMTVVLLGSLSSSGLAALTPGNIALGGDHPAIPGSNALYTNPAAVNATSGSFTLKLLARGGAWNNLLINDYISEEKKEELLSGIEDNGFLIGSEGNGGACMIIGPLAFFAGVRSEGLIRFTPDLAELLLKGNEIGKTYILDGSTGLGAVYGDAAVNFSVKIPSGKIPELYIGGTYHYLQGAILKFEGKGSAFLGYDVEGNPVFSGDGEMTLYYNDPEDQEHLARGTAFDVGIYAELNPRLALGLSVMDIGYLSSDRAYYMDYHLAYSSDNQQLLEEVEEGVFAEGLEYKLPRKIRLGGRYQLKKRLNLYGMYSNVSYGNGMNDNRYALGVETGPAFLPLRLGVNYSTLRDSLQLAGGFGLYLGWLKFDLGIADLIGLFNRARGAEIAVTTRVEF